MPETNLPEGTDKVIAGASADTTSTGAGAGSSGGSGEDALIASGNAGAPEALGGTGAGTTRTEMGGTGAATLTPESPSSRPATESGGASGIVQKLRSGGEKVSGQAADKARGIVSQGLERSAEALANVSRLIGDTAPGLDERLGAEYGEYARKAAAAIENTANSLASKDPDELIDDTREFVRRSPGVALAGAAIVGFAVARLLKTTVATARGNGDEDGGSAGNRSSRSES